VVVDTAAIAGSNDSVFDEPVAQIGFKPVCAKKKEFNKQAIHFQQLYESRMGTINRQMTVLFS
jgi:hypothetical protein